MKPNSQRGVAMLVALMVIMALLFLGKMVMLLADNVTQRSGFYRRAQRTQYCAEEGLNLGRAWVLQQIATNGNAMPVGILSGTGSPVGNGLLTDPANSSDFAGKDLCTIAAATYGGNAITGLFGICRTDPTLTYCGSPPCSMYRINLVDDLDEPITAAIDPFTDRNQTFFIRAECMTFDTAIVNGQQQDQVAYAEVNEVSGGNCYGSAGSGAGCGGGYAN